MLGAVLILGAIYYGARSSKIPSPVRSADEARPPSDKSGDDRLRGPAPPRGAGAWQGVPHRGTDDHVSTTAKPPPRRAAARPRGAARPARATPGAARRRHHEPQLPRALRRPRLVVRLPGKDTGLLGIDRARRARGHARGRGGRRRPGGRRVPGRRRGCLVTAFIAGGDDGRASCASRTCSPRWRRRCGRSTAARRCRDRFDAVRTSSSLRAHRARARRRASPARSASLPRRPRRDRGGARPGPEHAPVPCHNDLLAANFIHDGERAADRRLGVRGHGRPLLRPRQPRRQQRASTRPTTSGCSRPTSASRRTPRRLAALRLMRLMSDFREAMWGVVQTAISELDFDFAGYADEHFERVARRGSPTRASALARGRRVARELPGRARCVIIGGGVGGSSIAYHLAELGWQRRRAARPRRAHPRLDVPLRRARRPAARLGLADADDDVLGRALPEARRRRVRPGLGRVRRHPARLLAGALGGDAPPGRLGEDVRAAAGADLAPRRRRSASR